MPQILKNSRFVAQIENGFDKTHIITINFEDLQFEKVLASFRATLLVGRCVEFRIMPFSFAESYE